MTKTALQIILVTSSLINNIIIENWPPGTERTGLISPGSRRVAASKKALLLFLEKGSPKPLPAGFIKLYFCASKLKSPATLVPLFLKLCSVENQAHGQLIKYDSYDEH